jgi:hypothetical protein
MRGGACHIAKQKQGLQRPTIIQTCMPPRGPVWRARLRTRATAWAGRSEAACLAEEPAATGAGRLLWQQAVLAWQTEHWLGRSRRRRLEWLACTGIMVQLASLKPTGHSWSYVERTIGYSWPSFATAGCRRALQHRSHRQTNWVWWTLIRAKSRLNGANCRARRSRVPVLAVQMLTVRSAAAVRRL